MKRLKYDIHVALEVRGNVLNWEEPVSYGYGPVVFIPVSQKMEFRDSIEYAKEDSIMPDIPLHLEVLGFEPDVKTTRKEWKHAYHVFREMYYEMSKDERYQ